MDDRRRDALNRVPLPVGGFMLEWFRPDPTRELVRVWKWTASLVGLGALTTALAFVRLEPLGEAAHLAGAGLGLLLTVTGMVWTVSRALAVLTDERCLVVRSDGVVVVGDRVDSGVIAWPAIDAFDYADDCLVIRSEQGVYEMKTKGIQGGGEALQAYLVETRRKALMGLLRPRD